MPVSGYQFVSGQLQRPDSSSAFLRPMINEIKVTKSSLQEILSLRALFLQENNFQIRYNACHERNWSDSWLITLDGSAIGYGSVKGKDDLKDRNAIFEFYVIPTFRKHALDIFSMLLVSSRPRFIECQSNDLLLSSMLYEFSSGIQADVVLLKEHVATELKNPELSFRPRKNEDTIFQHAIEPVGEYVLEHRGEIVATGGFMLHYNVPFADLYMEVREDSRRKGFASFLLQEVKKECYLHGRVPAARCPVENLGSRKSLIRAGMAIAGYMLTGAVTRMSW